MFRCWQSDLSTEDGHDQIRLQVSRGARDIYCEDGHVLEEKPRDTGVSDPEDIGRPGSTTMKGAQMNRNDKSRRHGANTRYAEEFQHHKYEPRMGKKNDKPRKGGEMRDEVDALAGIRLHFQGPRVNDVNDFGLARFPRPPRSPESPLTLYF